MNLFVLVALLCTDNSNGDSQCSHYALDSNLSAYECDYYFTDTGVMAVDKLVATVENEQANKLSIETLECVQEDTE